MFKRYLKNILIQFIIIFIFGSVFVLAGSKNDSSKIIDFKEAYNTKAGNKVLATIGNKKITVREFLTNYEFGPSFTKREKDSKKKYLKYMINEKLLAMYGYKHGLQSSQRVKNLLNAIKGDLASDALFYDKIFNKVKVTQKELKRALKEKQKSYQIKWLYAPNINRLNFFRARLLKGTSFDTLFALQLKQDSVFADERSMKEDLFKMRTKNPVMAKIVDSLKVGEISKPIKANDGYYIVKVVDQWENMIVTESQRNKESHDARQVIKLGKADAVSDKYVHKMMLAKNPVIKGKTFDILRSYMGNYVLPKQKYETWNLAERMQKELKENSNLNKNNIGALTLVKMNKGSYSLDDFIDWYKARDNYLKFNEKSFNTFSASLESMIWQMVRDHLLISRAYADGYQNKPLVKDQINWWRDKIVYAVVRDELANSVGLNIESPTSLKKKNQSKQQALIEKMFRKLQSLKKQYKIKINESVLASIKVQTEDDPRAVDFYTVKKGGTFPHPAYPSIDFSWQAWE